MAFAAKWLGLASVPNPVFFARDLLKVFRVHAPFIFTLVVQFFSACYRTTIYNYPLDSMGTKKIASN
jgi:hypothetical protein